MKKKTADRLNKKKKLVDFSEPKEKETFLFRKGHEVLLSTEALTTSDIAFQTEYIVLLRIFSIGNVLYVYLFLSKK